MMRFKIPRHLISLTSHHYLVGEDRLQMVEEEDHSQCRPVGDISQINNCTS